MVHWLKPAKTIRYMQVLYRYLFLGCLLSASFGLYQSLVVSPEDYQQGNAVRMMYVHVPAAWMSLLIYMIITIASISHTIWRNPLSSMIALSSAPLGLAFTIICIVTGMLWGKPIWGAWWVWDARLTSVMILAMMYVGYLLLYYQIDDRSHAENMVAIFAIVGCVNLPIIKFSVEWWNTLHQPASIMRMEGIAIDSSMLWPLMLMFLAAKFWYAMMLVNGVMMQYNQRKIERIRLKQLHQMSKEAS